MSGRWPFSNYPETIRVDGRAFHRAGWQQSYPGVVAQYREASELNSRHLFVYQSGRWAIDHVDQYNPDMGRPVEHFFADHPIGQAAVVVGGLALVLGLVVKVAEALEAA